MDRGRLVQVFENLVDNALRHSSPGATVHLAAERELRDGRAWVACTVRDEGPGFADADLPHLFEPFYTRRAGGTGLGLSIVERIVRDHGGEVRAANAPGGGGLVTVWLPAAEGSA
jgi:signal transduction histidine kinase